MTNSLDQDFDAGLRLAKESYQKKVVEKDAEIARRNAELDVKDIEIKELRKQLDKLTRQYKFARTRMAEMSKAITKLASFKQNVMASLNEDQEDECIDLGSGSGMNEDGSVKKRQSVTDEHEDDLEENSDLHVNSRSLEDTFNTTTVFSTRKARDRPPMEAASSTNRVLRSKSSSDSLRRSSGSHLNTSQNGQANRSHSVPHANVHERKPQNVSFNDSQGSTDTPVRAQSPAPAPITGHSFVASTYGNAVPESYDGAEFFRRARSEISYDKFTKLVHYVRMHNNREKTRAETLKSVGELLDGNASLSDLFRRLLSDSS
ncbi:hypothetical protein DFJ77DRAFT_56338 [Powellomyces hirtus]|nr:hypothetical protein DFJ77DRAFT_56338 [Powellomyces hirtus]